MNSDEKATSWDTRRCGETDAKISNDARYKIKMETHSCYLVEVKLAHERAREGVTAVHGHDNGPGVCGGQQGCYGLQELKCQTSLLDLALLGPHQVFSQGLLQGQGQLAGGGAWPAGVHLQGEYLGGGKGADRQT